MHKSRLLAIFCHCNAIIFLIVALYFVHFRRSHKSKQVVVKSLCSIHTKFHCRLLRQHHHDVILLYKCAIFRFTLSRHSINIHSKHMPNLIRRLFGYFSYFDVVSELLNSLSLTIALCHPGISCENRFVEDNSERCMNLDCLISSHACPFHSE